MKRGWLSRNPPPWMIRKTSGGWGVFRLQAVVFGNHYISMATYPKWCNAIDHVRKAES